MAWFSDGDLRRLAGAKSYGRGVDYVGAVGIVDELPDGVAATVEGAEEYVVRLTRRGGLRGECSCPWGQDGNFCKHCVAVGLSLLAAEPAGPRRRAARTDLRAFLRTMPRDELIDLVLRLAEDDPALYRRLSLRAATHGEPDVKELRRLIGGLRGRGFLAYGRSFDFARKAGDVLDALDEVAARHPGPVVPLYRTAIQHLTSTLERADDSAGAIGDVLERVVASYAKACRAAPPDDPAELATWLIDFQVRGPGWPELPIAEFSGALGETGLSAYRRHLSGLAGDDWAVRHLREDYLRVIAKDTDALVALYAEELPQAYQYVRIAQALRDAGRPEEAIRRLRRGRNEADRPDPRIGRLLAELLTGQGDHGEAVDVWWELFTADPTGDRHRGLLDAAERAGTLTAVADRALAHLYENAARGPHLADVLLRVLLDTGDADAAWDATQRFPCGPGMRYTVAQIRARTHPAEALPVFADRVAAAIDRRDRRSYDEAARTLAEMRDLYRRAGEHFDAFLTGIREQHRRKSAFLAALARMGL
ncbi:SWIM zinc finger family protein [Actinoplanes teichomyceticus]|uniref:Putative Zn finger protein n=1 Tax=Actinoplanes teichomyceticus TaxID=1867 RepID=A0A561WB76_ACTTI|nr:DUF6880 family protein [Actinoplanes teichomyceticus]TWG21095.1 putative Zn finger protein [Actinoplanes teichomyceticus]GIF14914.1 hypothetical protein Ate01nite_49460 [Actinoplanes teichomyceticus]